MQYYEFIAARGDTGAVLPLAKITVYLAGTVTLATLYDATGTPLGANPLTAAISGLVGFAAANGSYDVQIGSADGTYLAPKVHVLQLYDLGQLDAKVASVTAVAADAGFIAVATDMALGAASKIAIVATDLLLGAASVIKSVATDMALGGAASFILRAPAAAVNAVASASAAAASAVTAAANAAAAGIKAVSNLAQTDNTTTVFAYSIVDSTNRMVFGIASDGRSVLDLHPTARAYSFVIAQAQAAVTAVGAGNASGIAQRSGLSQSVGSPNLQRGLSYSVVDSAKCYLFGVSDDGTFQIAKYDSRILSAVQLAESPGGMATLPYVAVESGQIVSSYGINRSTIVTEGVSSDVRPFAGKIAFMNDRYRGIRQPYTANYDGTNQRALLSAPLYEVIVFTGQSLQSGEAVAAITTSAPYPNQLLMLTGGPIFASTNTVSPTATLTSCLETSHETIATSMGAAILDHELALRPNLKLVMLGHASTSQPYTNLKKGTTAYNDIIAQVTRLMALAVAQGGSVTVRCVHCRHGESDIASTTYEADLVQWQSDLETDIRAVTLQNEAIPFLVSQLSSERFSTPAASATNARSPLAQLAAARDNTKFVITSPDYWSTYIDNLHPVSASQRLKGEYEAKAYIKAICEGREWWGVCPKPFAQWVIGSTTIDIPFYVPVGSLVLDTALATDPGNYGFTYSDSAGRTISVALKPGATDTIRVTASGAIGTSAVLDFAFSNGTDGLSGKSTGARGCLRDSDPALSRWDGTTPLYNAGVGWRQPIN